LSGDDPLRVFAAGSVTNRLRIEVDWRSGKRSVIEGAVASRIYEVTESGVSSPAAPQVATPAPPPVFAGREWLLGHVHHEAGYEDFERQPLLSRRLSQCRMEWRGAMWTGMDGRIW
jgi:hypothetical protein